MGLYDQLDLLGDTVTREVHNDTWRPEDPPSLDGVTDICLNLETFGLRWWEQDRPGAISIFAKGRSWYLPFRHAGSGNLDEATVKRWAQREIRGKHIRNSNTRFDVHMARVWDVDLEEQGNTFSDIGHTAALLNNLRFNSGLDTLIPEYLGERPMPRLDETRLMSYSAGAAMPRARYNVEKVDHLWRVMGPQIESLGLSAVQHLEDQVIPIVCEMEKNGMLLNQELLEQWIIDTKNQYYAGIMEIYKATGLKVNPGSGPDKIKLFNKLKIPILEYTQPSQKFPDGQASFLDEVLKPIKHPVIKTLRHTIKLGSLNTKLKSFRDSVDSKGILRYGMHQLRAAKDDSADSGESGTVNGRFTSSAIIEGFGVNIQQVPNPERQILNFGDEFFIRDLVIPDKNRLFFSADAEQIQYRLAANEAKNPKVLAAYKENPRASFHKMMHKNLLVHKKDMTYKRTKDTNFAFLFTAGLTKLSLMLEFITKKEFFELRKEQANRNHPKLQQAAEILKIYNREMPEMKGLQRRFSSQAEAEGLVRSLMGRILRFDGTRLHKALNSFIMGSEADVVKEKMVEVHAHRKETGFLMRAQVHDELDGDVPDEESARKVHEVLERQNFPQLEIPILWGMNTGKSWGDCQKDKLDEIRKELAIQ